MDAPLILGESAVIKNLLALIKKIGKSDANVLILGETGVGKELAAKAIHFESKRRDKPFIKLNCGSLNENLAESELFGHRRGAFTGAFIDRPGLIEIANGGTFLFDEIGDANLSFQAKLVSVVEDKEIRRLGENYARTISARFIFATNRDLGDLVAKEKFRLDLYYRINILNVNIPPLHERREDIPLLVDAILYKESQKKSVSLSISKEAINKISEYPFPGNVRELENILIRASELSNDNIIKESDICFRTKIEKKAIIIKLRNDTDRITKVLANCDGNKTRAAKELGISRVHLYRLLDIMKRKNDTFHNIIQISNH